MKTFSRIVFVLSGTTAVLVGMGQSAALGLTNEEVAKVSRAVTVQIAGIEMGSGVIIKHQGNIYTVLSAEHVVATGDSYHVITSDGEKHLVDNQTIKKFPEKADLAILQFSSSKTYQVVELGRSSVAKAGNLCYVSGFPAIPGTMKTYYQFSDGQIVAHGIHGLERGYALSYSNFTFAGMSGGPVLNVQGELIGIHGQSLSPYQESRGIDPQTGIKLGLNLAVPLNRFLQLVNQVSPSLRIDGAKPEKSRSQETADDILIEGVGKAINGDEHGALAEYNRAAQISPQNSFIFFARAGTRAILEDKRGAMQDYDQSIRLNPNFADAYLNRGNTRAASGNNKGAIQDYDQAIRLNSNFAAAYGNRGSARSDLGNKQGAIQDYDQAIRLNPKYAAAYYNRGVVRSDLRDKQGAIQDYDQAIRLNPKYAAAYNNRGSAHSDLGNKQGAIQDYGQAIRLNPEYANAYFNRGGVRSALGDKQGAIQDYNQAIRLNPKDAGSYINRGVARAALGDRQGAIRDYQQAADLFKANGQPELYRQLMEILQKAG
jgi:tetratricopeptide (TPR) repeat protein